MNLSFIFLCTLFFTFKQISNMKELEEIITEVGGKGTFQKRLLYLILAPIYFLQPLYWMNELFFLHVPSHWCNPPNTDLLNFLNETRFKDCYIPRKEIDNSFDTCNILVDKDWANSNGPNSIVPSDPTYCPSLIQKENPLDNEIIETTCEWGWNFDKSEFSRTLVTDLEWFCDKAYIIPAMYTCSKIGSMIGGVVFNYLGDRFGRKPIFWMTTFMAVIFMTVKTFLYKYYYVYAAFKILASGTFISIFQLPFSIICEVSDGDYRTWAILVSWLVWYVT